MDASDVGPEKLAGGPRRSWPVPRSIREWMGLILLIGLGLGTAVALGRYLATPPLAFRPPVLTAMPRPVPVPVPLTREGPGRPPVSFDEAMILPARPGIDDRMIVVASQGIDEALIVPPGGNDRRTPRLVVPWSPFRPTSPPSPSDPPPPGR